MISIIKDILNHIKPGDTNTVSFQSHRAISTITMLTVNEDIANLPEQVGF